MALQRNILKNQVKQAFARARKQTDNPDQVIDRLCDDIADAVDAYIRSATVTIPAGVAVAVVPATGIGATTAPGIGGIS